MKTIAVALSLALSVPALAHDHDPKSHRNAGEHAKKGEHEDAPLSFAKKPEPGTWAKCPVSKEVFKVAKDTLMAEHGGR